MEQQESSLEKRMIELIENINKFLDEFESRLKKDLQVILLIGMTGAGKSTIFNFLVGAEFQLIEKDDDADELKVVQDEAKFSAMKDGLTSITQQPKYYFNDQYNHLLIDFPGFQDTRGKLDKLMVWMLFFKIVTKTPTKIVFVLRHPENDLHDRGAGFQDFMNEQFGEQNIDSTNLTLILNSYGEKLKDEFLKLRLQKQLQEKFKKANENILVVRKIKDQKSLSSVFNKEKRQLLWEELIKSNAIKFRPKILPNSDIVSKYLRENSHQIVVKYCFSINQNLNEKIMDLSNQQITELNQSIKQLIAVLESNRLEDASEWYLQFIETCEIILEQLNCDDYLINSSLDFLIIFEHFLKFKEFLDGFEECQQAGILAQAQCSSMQTLINMKLIQLEEKRKLQEEINLKLKLLENEEIKRNEVQQSFLLEMEKNKDKYAETEKLQQEYEKLLHQNNQQIQDYNKQIQQLQAEQKEFIEKKRQENEVKLTELIQTINNLQQQFQKQEEQRRAEVQQRKQERELERKEIYKKDQELRRKDQEILKMENAKIKELQESRIKNLEAQGKQQQKEKELHLKYQQLLLQSRLQMPRYFGLFQ